MVKVIGPHRTGSTIIQNIGYFIIHKKQGRLNKNHNFELEKNIKYLVTIRDPRDIAISIYKKLILDTNKDIKINDLSVFKNPKILSDLEILIKIYKNHKNNNNSLILRFEEVHKNGFGNYDIAINKITNFLNVSLTDSEYDELYNILDYKKLKDISNKIETFKSHDVKTTRFGLHGGHINSKDISTWKNVIPAEMHSKYNNLLKRYLNETKYE